MLEITMELNKYLDTEYAAETREFRKKGGIVLSPSGVSKFYNEPNEWYLDRIGKTTFDGNTNTVLGNAIHGAIDGFWDNSDVTEDDVTLWVQVKYSEQMDCQVGFNKDKSPRYKVELEEVASNFIPMFQAWQNEYATAYPIPDLREYPLSTKINDNMMIAGTIDGYEEDRKVVIDYKTCNRKPSGISEAHRMQLLVYAFMMIAEGKEVDFIRVVYIQRATKTLPPRIWTFDEEVTDKMLLGIVDTIELMKKSWNAGVEHPELLDVLFRPNPVAKF